MNHEEIIKDYFDKEDLSMTDAIVTVCKAYFILRAFLESSGVEDDFFMFIENKKQKDEMLEDIKLSTIIGTEIARVLGK